MVDKKIVIIATIIAIIFFGVIFGLKVKNINNYEYHEPEEINTNKNTAANIVSENKISTEQKEKENVVETNEVNDNTIDENKVTENSVTENTSSENANSDKTTNSSSSDSSSKKEEKKNPEEIAISLAKEKWGKKNNNVYFDVEDKNESKGIYTIVVRDNSTTVEMVTYKVNINKKTVTEQ